MICPGEIASDVSTLQAAWLEQRGRHALIHQGRDGADDDASGHLRLNTPWAKVPKDEPQSKGKAVAIEKCFGAGRGSRTPKTRRSADFESAASASSAIPAYAVQRRIRRTVLKFAEI